ncbi:MAG: type II secretion system F family protein [Planctomycetaceae bacterium]|jgi:type II secretory pathway component PulF|nr:type II secretion system F family protein [Planctomycetaceae bacterium]
MLMFHKNVSAGTCEMMLLIAQAVKSGVPLADAVRLSVGSSGTETIAERSAFLQLATLLEKGIEPQAAVQQSGFSSGAADLFDVALKTDNFIEAFDELARIETNRVMTFNAVCQALAYPFFLFGTLLVFFLLFLLYIMPQFKDIFDNFGIRLPFLTEVFIWISDACYDLSLVVGIAVFAAILWIGIKLLFPRFLFCIPILGAVGRSIYMSKTLNQLAFFVLQNVPLAEALEKCGQTMRNAAYRKDCLSAAEAAKRGASFQEIVLRYYWLFPAWLAPMLVKNNTPESIARSLRRAAETTDMQKDFSLLLLQTLSLPLFILFIFGLVFTTVVATFLPLITLVTELS